MTAITFPVGKILSERKNTMPKMRALGIADDRKVVELEKSETPPDLEMFRVTREVFIEKKAFDAFIEKTKKEKGIKFSLSSYDIRKDDPKEPKSKTYYAFSIHAYKPYAILLNLPAWNNLKEKDK